MGIATRRRLAREKDRKFQGCKKRNRKDEDAEDDEDDDHDK